MKSILKAMVAQCLALLAQAIIEKYRPLIVMVTGSVGKTSTKDAAAAVLASRYHLRASEKSYNSEFGVPLTIIGAKNPWENPIAWLRVFKDALGLILLPSH
ncbi:MAG: Mur ligase family protein, partial [bacterium]|nr:Mur ligase family protein [bacterium]